MPSTWGGGAAGGATTSGGAGTAPTTKHMASVEFYPVAAGPYRVSAELRSQNNLLANQNGEFKVQGTDLEMSDPSTHPAQ